MKKFLFFLLLAAGIVSVVYTAKWHNDNRQPQVLDRTEQGEAVIIEQFKTYEEAIAKAKETRKRVIVVFGAPWCHWCHKLEETTLQDRNVKLELLKYHVVKVNVDERPDLKKKFSVRGVPAYAKVEPNEEIVTNGSGYKGPADFIRWLAN